MKKLIALMLTFLMVFSFAACGGTDTAPETPDTDEPKTEEPAPAPETEEPKAEEPAVAWDTDTDTEAVIAAIGKNFGPLPADTDNPDYAYLLRSDTNMAELSFWHAETGHFIFALMKKADEWTNIMKNFDVDYSNAVEDTAVMGHAGQVVSGDYEGMPMVSGVWFDANEGIVYALTVLGEGGTLEAYAADLFTPSAVG